MSNPPPTVSLQRSGTAVEIVDKEGHTTLLRFFEILRQLGQRPWDAQQAPGIIESASIQEDQLELVLGGQECALDLKELRQESVRPSVLAHGRVITTSDRGIDILDRGSVVIQSGRIAWVGSDEELKSCAVDLADATYVDLQGRLLTPGLIDCHAHPLFAGQRAGEFARRARGDHYLDIAKEGGGINATVQPTREASIETHLGLCARRMRHAQSWGTTTMEAKSGYDLRAEGELRLLRIAAMVDSLQPVDLMPTLLGAHAIPKEFAGDRTGFIASVCDEMIPSCKSEGLAGAVDVYCDEGAFTLDETRTILERAKQSGLAVKAHIGQFADLGGAQLLSELGGLSGDHLEEVSDEGIAAMAKAGVVATMLPGACVQLKMAPPRVASFRDAGVNMALASDLNPGTSHSENLALAMWLATTHLSMTVDEAWLGVTRNAARALGRTDIGTIATGKQADLIIWDAESHAEIPYHFGVNLVHQVVKAGHSLLTR
jgi:imidazolonepropionase